MNCPSDEIRADTWRRCGETPDAGGTGVDLRKSLAYLAVDAALVIAVSGATLAVLL